MQFARLAAALCLFAAACSNAPAAAPPASDLIISAAATGDERMPLSVVFENRGSSARVVSAHLTPVDGIDADILDVRRDGVQVRYIGKLVKLGASADHVTVDAGERLVMAVDPSNAYDMSAAGNYTVRFRAEALQATGGAEAAFAFQGRASVEAFGKPGADTCSAGQHTILDAAKSSAGAISNAALAYTNDNNSSSASYTRWFDASGANTYYAAIGNHYVTIAAAFATKPVTFDCKCRKNYYAYVYPNEPYKIYLCSVFWAAPATGRDSQAGTLVHEMSHFDVTAGTSDWVYGATAAQNLAITDPSRATDNADNHEYYAEDRF